MWGQDKNGSCILTSDSRLSESTQIFVQFLMQKIISIRSRKGVLLCLFPIFQEMLLSVSLVLYHKTGFLVGVWKQGILMLHSHTLWLDPMLKQRQAAACSCTGLNNWRHIGKGAAVNPEVWPDCCRGDTQSTAVPGLSDLRTQWS